MKNQKGITLIALTITIIALILTVAILSIVSQFFYSNKEYLLDKSQYVAEYNKFNMFFINDVKNNAVANVKDNEIVFQDGTVYQYIANEDNGIYRNKVKICNNIAYCNFTTESEIVNNTNKQIINVYMIIDSTDLFETTNNYVLKYW